jgi:hypothetical protein
MTYYDPDELTDDEMMSLEAAVAGYDEECRAWRAMEEELDDLRCQGIFR